MARAPKVDVVILTIREDEYQAVLSVFPNKLGTYQKQRHYSLRETEAGDDEKYTVAVLRQLEQGNGEAQEAARDALEDLRPSLMLVVGIAGGIPNDDCGLGDVVLSARIHDFSVESRKFQEETAYSLTGGPVDRKIASGIAALADRADDLGDWTGSLPARPPLPTGKKSELYGPKDWQKEVKQKLMAAAKRPPVPVFKTGPIASSDRLVKDPTLLFPWVQTARHMLAVEMESGGVYRAARDRCSMLSIRGISDIVGLKRDEGWTKFACASGAAFARAYLRTQPVTPRVAQTQTKPQKVKRTQVASSPVPDSRQLFLNLLPLKNLPELVFESQSLVDDPREAWRMLPKEGDIPPWLMHKRTILSYTDPRSNFLSKIVDPKTTKRNLTKAWLSSSNNESSYLMSRMLNLALRRDLGKSGVRYFKDYNLFAFSGHLDEPPRTYTYKGLKQKSTVTVVAHYNGTRLDGSQYPYLRHLGFESRFRELDGTWYLQITPTYLFTEDGKKRLWIHARMLSGIKRLEKNRAVLSQLLLLCDLIQGSNVSEAPFLQFGVPIKFSLGEAPGSSLLDSSIDFDRLKDQLIGELGR